MATMSCVVCCLITWPILLPINIVGPGNGLGFNKFNYAHAAAATNQSTYYRYYAHALCAYMVFGKATSLTFCLRIINDRRFPDVDD